MQKDFPRDISCFSLKASLSIRWFLKDKFEGFLTLGYNKIPDAGYRKEVKFWFLILQAGKFQSVVSGSKF